MPEAQPRWRSRRVQVARILVGVFGFILLNLLWAVFLLSQLPPPIAFPSTAVSVLIAGLVFALPFTREPGLNDGIVVDEGGLRWRKGKKRGYVFLRDIEDVGYAGVLGSPAIRVETNGGRLRLFTGGLPENLFIDDLNTRIAGLHSRDPHHEHADLARGGRSLATWLAEVRAARGVSEDAAYRTNERAPRDLLELACDRDADAEERAAAAHLVLLTRDHEAKARIIEMLGVRSPPIMILAAALAAPENVDDSLVVAALATLPREGGGADESVAEAPPHVRIAVTEAPKEGEEIEDEPSERPALRLRR